MKVRFVFRERRTAEFYIRQQKLFTNGRNSEIRRNRLWKKMILETEREKGNRKILETEKRNNRAEHLGPTPTEKLQQQNGIKS